MTDTEKGAREVFEALKRPGECWHKKGRSTKANPDGDYWCVNCKSHLEYAHENNPDFSTPEGFFWMWERLKEKEWVVEFFKYLNEREVSYINFINPTALYQATLAWVRDKKKGA